MKCPECSHTKTSTSDCRLMGGSGSSEKRKPKSECKNIFRRRRTCLKCSHVFSTYEITFGDWDTILKDIEQLNSNKTIKNIRVGMSNGK